MTDIQARIDRVMELPNCPWAAIREDVISIIKELQAIMKPNTPELEETFLRNWLFGSIVIPYAVKSRIIEKATAELQAQLSAKDAQIQRYEFKKDDEANVRAGLFRDLTNMKAIAEKKLAEKDAIIAELQKENESCRSAVIEEICEKYIGEIIKNYRYQCKNDPMIGPYSFDKEIAWHERLMRALRKQEWVEPPKGI